MGYDTIHEENYKGYTINVWYDECIESPREYDDNSMMVCKHKRYNLPNEIDLDFNKFDNWEQVAEHIIAEYDPEVILPIYMLDHSGISLSTSDFNDRWDSGQVGFIFNVVEDGDTDADSEEVIIARLKQDVENYSKYLNGECYYGRVEVLGDDIFNCGGFDDMEYLITQAKEDIDAYLKRKEEAKEAMPIALTVDALKRALEGVPGDTVIYVSTGKEIYVPASDTTFDTVDGFFIE